MPNSDGKEMSGQGISEINAALPYIFSSVDSVSEIKRIMHLLNC